tara:strand:+ start:1092 stop:1736 length:645 start_codon:yes stop_codon:yes gene_type:complete
MTAPPGPHILLADDHAVLRAGLRRLFESAGLRVVGEAETGEQACQLHAELQPHVLVMDLSMPGMGGIEALRRVRQRDARARVVILSMHESATFATQALRAGALGYVAKSAAADELIEAVQQAAQGRVFISAAIARQMASSRRLPGTDPATQLSSREFEIFRLLAEGQGLEAIAARLHISMKTVANHQTMIKQKLRVGTPIELVRLALQHGIVAG